METIIYSGTAFIDTFLISIFMSLIIVVLHRFNELENKCFNRGIQDIHLKAIPRIGGVAIYLSLILTSFYNISESKSFVQSLILYLFPVFIFGVLEDFRFRVSPRNRLIMTFFSASLLTIFLDIRIIETGLYPFDFLLNFFPFVVFVSILSIASMSQAMNIIDGLNGLSMGVGMIILFTVGTICNIYNDYFLLEISNIFIFSILGVFILNWPKSFLFVGDGGAYLIGASIATVVIMMPERNASISSFSSLVLVFFPIYETLRSFFRRVINKDTKWSMADNYHLHSKIYIFLNHKLKYRSELANSLASLFLLIYVSLGCYLAYKYHSKVHYLIIVCVFLIIIYEAVSKMLGNSKVKN